MRIVSLIPSATEIVAALGFADCLVGRSHECDFPARVKDLPVCTEPKFDPVGSSQVIHERVTELLQSALSVYRIDTALLQTLRPTHIITQAQCEVCAVSLGDVEAAAAQVLGHSDLDGPQIISLQPNTLEEVWNDIERVAEALGAAERGQEVVSALRQRSAACADRVAAIPQNQRPNVACIEWIEPLMAAGNWVPELVELAGGICQFGAVGQHSPWMTWEELLAADPAVIVTMPCGFDIAKTRTEMGALTQREDWLSLQAVRQGNIYLTDGNQYFNRPGPRLVESMEILQAIFYGQTLGNLAESQPSGRNAFEKFS